MLRTSALLLFIAVTLLGSSAFAEVMIEVTGLQAELQSQMAESIEPPSALKKSGPVNQIWLERYRLQLPQRIRDFLEPFGYFHADITTEQEVRGHKARIRVHIDPGPAIRLVERHIELLPGSHDGPELPLESFPLKPGDILREDLYEAGKAELLARVQDQGFLEARYKRHEVQIDREQNRGRIFLEIEAGERSRFGLVSFTGGEAFPERFLRRYLAFQQGNAFSHRLLGKTQKQLRDSDRFRKVLVVPQPDERQGVNVPVRIELEARKRYALRPGIGYGTDTGTRVGLRYSDANAWELGHKFNLDMQLSQRLQNYTGSYAFPGYRNFDTGLNLHGGYRAEQLDNYSNNYIFTEVEQTYGFGRSRIGALFARAQYERSDISADAESARFLLPGLRYAEVQLPEATGKGYGFHLQGEFRFSDQRFLSDISLMQLLGNGALLLRLPWRMSITLRGQVATTIIDNPFEEIPASLRFFAGGDRSVRGYAYQSLGPQDVAGLVVGGKHLLSGSVELGLQVKQNWGIALFIDTGNAFDSWADYVLESGAGAGLRYMTPVGPIQIDLASPLAQGRLSLRLHVGIGFAW